MPINIQLPCEAETTVYYINRITWTITKCIIHEFSISADGIFAILDDEYKGIKRTRIRGVKLSDFGETVFLTYEEAAEAVANRAVKK